MPTYEYECKSCGTVIDVFQSIKARPLKQRECPQCGRVRPVQRLIGSGGALLFKGSGFYITDYRGENYRKAAKAESDSGKPATGTDKPAEPEKKSTSSSESKPAEKPAAKSAKPDKKK